MISTPGLVAVFLLVVVSGLTDSQELKVRSASDQASCPLLEGVFVSIMRRIFNPGYHKVILKIFFYFNIVSIFFFLGSSLRG